MSAGKVNVEGGLLQIVMTEQHLNGAQVGAGFVKMSRKGMPQRVDVHGFVEARALGRVAASAPDRLGVEGLRGVVPAAGREKPYLGMESVSVLA
jgi:hypothetical protein